MPTPLPEKASSPNTFIVPRPGAYSLHFFAFDKAGNYKTGRTLFLFDDQSVVDKYEDKQTICSTSSQNTSYQWVVTDTDTLQIIWTDRFINSRHKDNRWLNEVQTFSPSAETSIYEDLYGKRTNKLINNQHGIVDFQVSFQVHSPLLKDSRPLTSVSDIHNQYDILKVNWADGDRLTSTVRALDVLGKFNEDTIIIYRDVTPPVIENLWLTRGDRVNISVHRIEDFTQMTIEWEAYDDHSGLDSIYWKLYDKYGGTEVLHGHEDIITQGGADALEECENMYKSYARGANCYCTPFMGCFHRHFQVKPEIKAHGGLVHNLYKGVHDYDYHIDISVTNKANITTLLTKKITIDISPPHAGVVHDGIVGSPEVDYQQELTIRAYWDQFFDRESGVFFYQYIVGSSCANKEGFDLELTHPNVVETYDTFASDTFTSEGTYYFTVIAYNRALEPSDPVCSDGVTIDTSVPSIEQVTVENAIIMEGLIKDTSKYYILGSDRNRRLISNPTTECIDKATLIPDIDLYPLEQYDNGTVIEVNGTVFCQNSTGAPSNIGITLSKSSMMEISWIPVLVPGQIYDYEVGLSSTSGSSAPDLLAFQSTKQHAHYLIRHSNIPDGTRFFIVIKTISKSNKEGITSIGPCFVDTTPPDFTGSISLTLSGDYLLATWASDAFVDSEEFYDLDYEFSIGHEKYSTDVQGFIPLKEGGGCFITSPPICTAVKIIDLDWYLHGHHTYYISIKVTNTAGLTAIQASSPYIHDVQLPAEGFVLDIDSQNFTTDIPLKDIEDIDFQADKTSIASRWSGFVHPHLDVTYRISIGSTKGGSDIISLKDVGSVTAHKETGLSLEPLKKYFVTVTAVTSAGKISVSSDGVTIVTENAALPGVMIYDGKPCNMTDFTLNHHEEDHRFPCLDDIDVQMSLNSIKAYWTVPENIQTYTFDALFAIERRSSLGDMWFPFHGFDYVSTVFDITVDDLTLSPGFMYRVVLKLCANTICFQTISTDGVMVMSSPPATGAITLQHLNVTVGGGTEKLLVTFDQFYDPDIENTTEKYDAVPTYEYAITDNSLLGKMYTPWTSITSLTTDNHKVSFVVPLTGEMDFSRCKRFTIRGYNKAKHYSIVSTEIKDCAAYNPILINPNIVIDAVGQPDLVDGIGRTIYLTKNDYWTEADQDYTPYKNVISAVWPTLRHRSYTYAVLNAKTIDVTTYYRQINQLSLKDPCDHPDAIKCGATNSEFMNVEFDDGELIHGTRYTVCVYANPTVIEYEMWTDILPEVNSCSDGIIVDLTPPVEGRVWIGNIPTVTYQTVTTDMYVNWDGFYDVEEYDNGPHSTGIKEYILGIGTTSGGNDVFPFENVGTVQHKALHGFNLQNGYKYYATIKAVDFANRETTVMSDPVIVDITPPDKSNDPITITNLHITSTAEIEACWKNVFTDLESGIDYFLWSIGSEPGYVDMMPYVTVFEEECDTTDKNNPLDLLDGHYYYINVRAFNKAGLSSLATSWAFQVDTTPPTPGHVYDGDNTVLTGDVKDIDYQTETKVIHVYWEGFHDTHSIIQEYYVSVGTCPQCEDILTEQAVGITNEFTLKDIHLGTGLRYYTTVTACNTASMCTSVTSDGVVIDNSPPIAGHVQDGTGFYDTQYQSMRTYISAKWYGFDDPQSGLQKYEWRAGTSIGGDDIVSPTELHLTEVLALNDLSLTLPVNQKIYLTIRAYNRAGLWTESSSNGFIVDITAPVVSTSLTFAKDYGINGLTQIYRDSMKVEWDIDDPESFIKRQYLSISSHIGGEFNLSSIHVNGIARWYVITGLDLHDSVTYYVTLISCNGAEICITSTSPGIFVDSSKPSRGMFAINTDHAVNSDLSRHSDGWMTWTSASLYLAWLGFSDTHSSINHYKVTVGSSYMATDVGKKPDAKYIHSTANEDNGDEGKVQLFKVQTKGLINYDILYVSIWAVNGVGLRSDLIYSAFRRVPGGALELIRRCDSMSCEGHCVCAPQDQKCPSSPSLNSCTDISSNNSNSILLVMDSNGYSSTDLSFTSSANILRGQWIISQSQGLAPLWYEWSVGYTGFSTPTGIYNLVDEKNWQDGGQFTDGVYITNRDVNLVEHSSYSFYVRVWYTVDSYAVFKSDGITVFSQTPPVASVRGKVSDGITVFSQTPPVASVRGKVSDGITVFSQTPPVASVRGKVSDGITVFSQTPPVASVRGKVSDGITVFSQTPPEASVRGKVTPPVASVRGKVSDGITVFSQTPPVASVRGKVTPPVASVRGKVVSNHTVSM
ncbi:uncharacterized protein [Mytilus edulis]|uniref:uncharacterized protein n=1 Tax=Mytilus edulis TaxID=6550 RepID=UPI0039EFF792